MSTLTVPAPKIEIGDRIDGRTVRVVTGRKRQTASNAASGKMFTGSKIPALSVSGHVVCVHFEDDGPPRRFWGKDSVEVERGAARSEAA